MLAPILLLIVGLAFVVAEVFFVSMGLLSVLAGACIIAADMMAFEHSDTFGWTLIGAQVLLVPLLIRLAFQALPHLPFGRAMLLDGPVTEPGAGVPEFDHLVGHTGRALSDLRPSGMAEFGSERVSVVAVGGFIPREADVRAVSADGSEVRVRAESLPATEDA